MSMLELLLSAVILETSIAANYIIDSHINCNNVYGSTEPSSISYPYITLLGKYGSLQECQQACISYTTGRCDSYTYYHDNSKYNQNCYAYINNTVWIPFCNNQTNIDTSRIIYPCTSNIDCSLNGKCNKTTGKCECNAAWNGYKCGNLTLLPATKGTGYNYTDNGTHTSSWGASIQYNKEKNLYDMFVAEFQNHCGINSWLRNSQIMHAESQIGVDKYNSNYTRKSRLLPPFAHSPGIIYAPNTDEYVLIYVHNLTSNIYTPCNECIDGITSNCPNSTIKTNNMTEVTSIRWIDSLSKVDNISEWSDPLLLYNTFGNGDSNFAAQININGSLIGMIRKFSEWNGHTLCCHNVYLVTASNWKDNTTYIVYNNTNNGLGLFPYLPSGGTEDMYIYKDCNGNWHALFHNRSPSGGGNAENEVICGGHAFSKNGIHWIYSGLAYTNSVEYNDGTMVIYARRERPHLVFDLKDQCTPVLLSTSAEYYQDATFTLLQPIKQ